MNLKRFLSLNLLLFIQALRDRYTLKKKKKKKIYVSILVFDCGEFCCCTRAFPTCGEEGVTL